MNFHRNCNILPIETCPRHPAEDYVLVIQNRLDKRGTPIAAFSDCDIKTGRKYFSFDGEVDEDTIIGWIDFRNEAIDPNEVRLRELGALIVNLTDRLDKTERHGSIASTMRHGLG